MPQVQNQDARKLLNVISSTMAKGKLITYSEAAVLIGRPSNHSRAVAQMCDLLDAAACLAGIPLLALIAVREKSLAINSKAFESEYGVLRNVIIRRSLSYPFGTSDFHAIANALKDLGDRGNRKAWHYVNSLYPNDLLFRRLTGDYHDMKTDAIDDLGTDAPDRAKSEVWFYARDPKVRGAVMARAGGKCEFCGELGFLKIDGTRYLESHHVIALAKDGEDRLTNVMALCPNDHRKAHFAENCEYIEGEMILKLKSMQT